MRFLFRNRSKEQNYPQMAGGGQENKTRTGTGVIVAVCGGVAVVVFTLLSSSFLKDSIETLLNKFSSSTATTKECKKGSIRKILLDETKYPEALCIDGSRPAYYLRKGYGEGENKWFVHFEGGGWCYDYAQCQQRKQTPVGSSNKYPTCIETDSMKFYMSGIEANNPMMYNWNIVHVRYCDGSSYAGDTTVIYEQDTLFFRGRHNRDGTILSLLREHDMAIATEVVISGCSAGGLGIYLGLDHIASLIKSANANTRIRGLSDSGFFLDHTSDSSFSKPRPGMTKYEAHVNGILDYATTMKRIYDFMNVSAGTNKRCVMKEKTSSGESSNCIFAQNLAPHIRTPLFAIQPKYDQWQLWHVVGKPFNYSVVNRYGARLQGLLEARLLRNPQHGAFIDACTHHCTSCSTPGEDSWHGKHIKSTQEQITPAEAFKRWYSRGGGITGISSSSSRSGAGNSSSDGGDVSISSSSVSKTQSDANNDISTNEKATVSGNNNNVKDKDHAHGRSRSAMRRRRSLSVNMSGNTDKEQPSPPHQILQQRSAITTEISVSSGMEQGTAVYSKEGRVFVQIAEYPCHTCCVCRP